MAHFSESLSTYELICLRQGFLVTYHCALFVCITAGSCFLVKEFGLYTLIFTFLTSAIFYSLDEVASDLQKPFKDSNVRVSVARVKQTTIDIQNMVTERAIFWEKEQQDRDRRVTRFSQNESGSESAFEFVSRFCYESVLGAFWMT